MSHDFTYDLALMAIFGGDNMTRDTERALEAIKPLADALGITISADEHYLHCNNESIGIECNSTSATIKEFVGYLFKLLWIDGRWVDRFKGTDLTPVIDGITLYWRKEDGHDCEGIS